MIESQEDTRGEERESADQGHKYYALMDSSNKASDSWSRHEAYTDQAGEYQRSE